MNLGLTLLNLQEATLSVKSFKKLFTSKHTKVMAACKIFLSTNIISNDIRSLQIGSKTLQLGSIQLHTFCSV